MSKNPLLNAAAASLYIVIVSSLMFYGTKFIPGPDSVLAPITILSLFTLSAAVMSYVFGYHPLLLFMEGKRKEAVELFLQTVGVFGGITFIILLILFSGVLPR